MPKEEMIEFILDMANDIEDLTDKQNYELVCELNNMSYEEVEKEFNFYTEMSLK